jgi:hypothetical protein
MGHPHFYQLFFCNTSCNAMARRYMLYELTGGFAPDGADLGTLCASNAPEAVVNPDYTAAQGVKVPLGC